MNQEGISILSMTHPVAFKLLDLKHAVEIEKLGIGYCVIQWPFEKGELPWVID